MAAMSPSTRPDPGPLPGPFTGPDGVLSRVRIGAYAWAERDGHVLLSRMAPKTKGAGSWVMPGGGVSFGEDPADAVLRELEEETGLEGELGEVLGVRSALLQPHEVPSGHRIHVIGILYRVTITGGELRDEQGGSTDHAEWIPLADLPTIPAMSLLDWARGVVGR